MELVKSMVTKNRCYLANKKIPVKGLMLHSVGCPQPSAEVFIKQFNVGGISKCVHAFIDGNTGVVYQTLPWDVKAWHCGGEGNGRYIGVEMCEPPCIRYTAGSSFTCSDREKAMAVVERTYRAAVELFATLCKQYGLNPLADGVIISHKEGHDRKIASGHGDPDHLWRGMNCGYSMDTFRRDVNAAMGGVMPTISEKPVETVTSASAGGNIQVGDVVSVTPEGTYYGGKEMPDWVKNDKWIVKSVSGDRVVIDCNTSGTKGICSPVHVSHLRKV